VPPRLFLPLFSLFSAVADYKVPKDILYQEVGDEVVVLDVKQGRYYGLNKTAGFIWLALVAPKKGKKTAEDYAAHFKITVEKAEKDFAAITQDLVKRGWIVEK
jgi:hypothetical protein